MHPQRVGELICFERSSHRTRIVKYYCSPVAKCTPLRVFSHNIWYGLILLLSAFPASGRAVRADFRGLLPPGSWRGQTDLNRHYPGQNRMPLPFGYAPMRGCCLDCHIRGCHGGTITMSLSYAPTRQFSAAIVNLSEVMRYAQFIRALPGLWCGWTVIELSSTLRVCPALVCPGAYPVKLLPLELHPHNRARPQSTVHRRGPVCSRLPRRRCTVYR